MTVRTVTSDELEQLAYDSGQTIHIGAHEADVTIGDTLYVARRCPGVALAEQHIAADKAAAGLGAS